MLLEPPAVVARRTEEDGRLEVLVLLPDAVSPSLPCRSTGVTSTQLPAVSVGEGRGVTLAVAPALGDAIVPEATRVLPADGVSGPLIGTATTVSTSFDRD